jgi:EAL domain-containing protein (putative c-di-GMP-specific phosphodiesterase class I)
VVASGSASCHTDIVDPWLLHYQPIIDLDNEAIVAVEALLRPASGVSDPEWLADTVTNIDAGTGIHPDEVIAVAVAAEVGVEVGVNVPAWALGTDLVGVMEKATAGSRSQTPSATAVCIEVTEGLPLPVNARAIAEALVALGGVRLALDDFGTGVRTLADLMDLPVQVVKLDRKFVSGLGVDRTATAMVAHTIQLARTLGLETIAEGVETPLQLRLLREMGCDRGQGWLWSPALPAAQLRGLLSSAA